MDLARINQLYGQIIFIRLGLAAITTALILTAGWLTGRPVVMIGALAIGGLGLLVYSVQGAGDAVLAGFERLDLSAIGKVIGQLAFILVGGVALWWGGGYYGLVFANLFGAVAMAIFCWHNVRRQGVRPIFATELHWARILRASFPFAVVGIALGLSYKFDSVLLNIFRGDAETGYYNASYNLVFSAALLANALNTALYPSLSRQFVSSPESLRRISENALRYLLILSLPIALGASVLADRLVPFLFTEAYTPAIPALRIVIWVVPLMFASEYLGYVVLIEGNERLAARAILFSTGVNILLNLLLVPRFGFVAAAMMTVITEAILVGQYLWLLRRLVRVLNWERMLWRPVLAVMLMGLVAVLLHGFALPVAIGLCGMVYFGLLVGLGALGKQEFGLLWNWRRAGSRPG